MYTEPGKFIYISYIFYNSYVPMPYAHMYTLEYGAVIQICSIFGLYLHY